MMEWSSSECCHEQQQQDFLSRPLLEQDEKEKEDDNNSININNDKDEYEYEKTTANKDDLSVIDRVLVQSMRPILLLVELGACCSLYYYRGDNRFMVLTNLYWCMLNGFLMQWLQALCLFRPTIRPYISIRLRTEVNLASCLVLLQGGADYLFIVTVLFCAVIRIMAAFGWCSFCIIGDNDDDNSDDDDTIVASPSTSKLLLPPPSPQATTTSTGNSVDRYELKAAVIV